MVENSQAKGRPAPTPKSSALLSARRSSNSRRHEIPVVVIEGLREANDVDEKDDKDVVINELSRVMPEDSSFTPASVVRAIRLPFVTTKEGLLCF